MSRLVPFDASHVDLIEMRDIERVQLAADPKASQKFEALDASHQGGTLFHDGRIIAFIGFFEMWPGVFEVWAWPSIYVQQYATVYLRTVKRFVKDIEKTFNPHRLQTTALADALHDRWMEFLGFHPEGDLKKYSIDRRDYRIWAKVYEEGESEWQP